MRSSPDLAKRESHRSVLSGRASRERVTEGELNAALGLAQGHRIGKNAVPLSPIARRGAAISTALTGSTANATATASITLPTGPSTLQATVTYTIVASLGDMLSRFAQNERVEKITLSAVPGGASKATLITVSGKQYDAPAQALQIAALGG